MSERRAAAGARGTSILLAILASLPSCWTAALRTIPETQSRYDTLPDSALRRLAEARAHLDAGDAEAASPGLAALAGEYPANVPVGIWLQEAEIALAEAGGDLTELQDRYRKRAENDSTVTNLVLAARLEPDPHTARVLLDRAETLDPRCAWCPYGKAWLAARAGEWKEVEEEVARARFADPGHMPTLWLETWMLQRSGGISQAITSLSTWIERAAEDPRIDPRLVLEARLDQALLAVQDGDPKLARKLLAELEVEPRNQARAWMIEAGAAQALGDLAAALAAAVEAQRLAPGDLLPVVQQAMLHEIWLGDPEAAEKDWARALELSRADPALGSLLERMRARVRLERYAAARAAAAPDTPAAGRSDADRPE